MKFTELKDRINEPTFCYLLDGEDFFFLERAQSMILKRYLSEPSLNYTVFDGTQLKGQKLKALADAIESFPFLSEKRIVRVNDFYPSEKEYETYLAPFFASPPQTTLLLIVNASPVKRAGIVDWKKKPVTVVDCSRADKVTIEKWIYLTFKRAGIAADTSVCARIDAYCLSDMSRISKETEKIILYLGEGGKVTDELVDELVYRDADYKVYEMSNAVARKDYGQFMRVMGELKAKGYDEISVLSVLCSYFKGLYEVKMLSGKRDSEIAATLEMKEYAARKNREQADKFEIGQLERWYFGLYELISGLKRGEVSPEGALSLAIAEILF